MTTALATLTSNFATRFGLGENQQELMTTLKATAFKGQVTDAQMTALMLVAQQYSLNPWTREIYAFPDKNNGIVPVVGVDGWSRIMNDHPQFDGLEFKQDDASCTCIIYRKDRAHPISATEYLDECKRSTGPWQSHPRRMLRHKAMIQCARLAFGFGGIYDQDEAERIIESDVVTLRVVDTNTGEVTPAPKPALEACSEESFNAVRDKHKATIQSGKKTPADLIAWLSAKTILSDEQKFEIDSWRAEAAEFTETEPGSEG
jgi:phage recombination protein Bet